MCMPVIAQKKYTDKDIASMKQKLVTSVAGHAKDVQVMVDQIFSFGELLFNSINFAARVRSFSTTITWLTRFKS